MSSSSEKIADVLKHAIRGEEEGRNYYDALAKKSTNDDARRKLEGLRDDEIRHKKILMGFYDKFVGGPIDELPEHGVSALAEVFKNGRLDSRKTEMDFITLAIDVELATMKFYQEQQKKAEDPEFGKVLGELADEEHGHFELLQAEKDALGGNYHWFSFDESSPMEH